MITTNVHRTSDRPDVSSFSSGCGLRIGRSRQSGTTVRLRGVSAVSAKVAWASGQGGTYTRTTDGGRTWRAAIVPGAEALDFRDVDAFDANTAYLLAIGEGDKSRIYKTTDGGDSWTMQFKNENPAAFFDAMAFWDRDHGIAMSDPVAGRFLIITTTMVAAPGLQRRPMGCRRRLKAKAASQRVGRASQCRVKTMSGLGPAGPMARASSAQAIVVAPGQ